MVASADICHTGMQSSIASYLGEDQEVFFKKIFIYLFLSLLGLRCCMQAFSSGGEQRLLFPAVCGLLIIVAFLVAEHGLQRTGSVAMMHGFSCPMAYGIFLDQESNLCLLHWQANSLPRGHQGSPENQEIFKEITAGFLLRLL